MKQALNTAIFGLAISLFVAAAAHAARPAASPSGQQAFDSTVAPTSVLGEVTAVDSSFRRVSVKTAVGQVVAVMIGDNAELLKVAPGEKSLEKAVKIELGDIVVGDKAYALGSVGPDKKSFLATKLVLMTKAEIHEKQERERTDWQKRGVAGVITALDGKAKEITVRARGRAGSQVLVVKAGDSTQLRRYLPDSIKFSDARAASFADLQVGDQIRILGEKTKDGGRLQAEHIVSGSFRTVGGTITQVNPETNEVEIAMLGTKQPLTIVIGQGSNLRRIPQQVAVAIARASQQPQRAADDKSSGQPVADLQEILERLPPLTLSQLKAGDVIAVSSTVGADRSRLTAISLIAGVDAVLTALQRPGARPAPLVVSTGLPAGVLDFVIGQQ